MTPPKPEHRISALEKRVTTLEGTIEELSSDTAEELRVIRQHVDQGFDQAHAFVQERFEEIKTILADHRKRLDRIETAQAEQGQILKEIFALLKQRPSE